MRLRCLLVFACSVALIQNVQSDVYLHNPRGSNNRLNGRNQDRTNANRVFDSQNNNRGGYNVGENTVGIARSQSDQYNMLYFMSGPTSGKSILHIEWTNQHGCGDGDLNCNIVLQYMCQPDISPGDDRKDKKRNGATERTQDYRGSAKINSKREKTSKKNSAVKDDRVLNEPWEWYDKCARRKRNGGLFTADQKLRGGSSKYTRQNPNGNRYGYECAEERDYYPYWHPTDWIDIAVLANKKKDCSFYQRESFNVKPKGECMERYSNPNDGWRHASSHNNPEECKKAGGEWVEFSNYLEKLPQYNTEQRCKAAGFSWAIPYRSEDIDKLPSNKEAWKQCLVPLSSPKCYEAPYSRSNHLGNVEGVVPLRYQWSLPYFPSGKTQRCVLRIRYNISTNDPQSEIKNDPVVKMFDDKLPLQLAINTAQFGRTFQDRSHLFKLRSRAGTGISNDCTLHNLNVRGKRGNIVQVYPAVEYDFIPKRLNISEDDCIHLQWTGSNTNPRNNAGEGTAGTDRSNIVQMSDPSLSFPNGRTDLSDMFNNAEIVVASDDAIKTTADLEVSMASAGFHKTSGVFERGKNNLQTQLNNAKPSFYGAVLKMKKGSYYYMCTRNNNFTNRSQKGRLTVQ